jgi:hypothetical protein
VAVMRVKGTAVVVEDRVVDSVMGRWQCIVGNRECAKVMGKEMYFWCIGNWLRSYLGSV